MKVVKKAKSKSFKMKSYDSFNLWKADQAKAVQPLIQALRKLVNDCDLPLTETVKWSNGCWVKDELPIVYIYAMKDKIQLGFFAGSLISDPKGILEGKGKFVRFITVQSKADIDPKYMTTLIKRAIKIKYR
jgi:hypothetical protein